MNLNQLFVDFSPEEIQQIDALPRAEKMEQLALLKNLPTKDALIEASNVTELPFLENFALIENPSEHLPVRLIHEYRCIPIQIQSEEPADEPVEEQTNHFSEDPLETLNDHAVGTEEHAAEADDTLDSIENEEAVFAETSDIEKESSQGLYDLIIE